MPRYDFLIVGAGLFGSVFAREAREAGKRCLVIDRRDRTGGNIRTEDVSGIEVHRYGAHIFHTSDSEVWRYMNRFTEFNNYINSPVAAYKDETYNLPFNMNTFSRLWNIRTPAEAKAIIEEQKRAAGITEPRNLEEQAISMVGTDIYEKLVKGYTEKQWGRSCRELPAFIIKRLPLRFTYDNNYFNDRYQGIPEDGYNTVIDRLLEGVEIVTGTPYERAMSSDAGTTVYTGMIDEYFGYSLGHLEYRTLRFESELIETDNYQGNAVVNYTEREIPYTRIIEHKHFKFGKQPVTVITREYPAAWKPGDEPYYPVNDGKNSALYAEYAAMAENERNVVFGGRLGSYKYFDMDKTVRAALDLSKKILQD